MFTILSLIGAGMLLLAFGLISFNVVKKGFIYNILNLLGSVCIVVSVIWPLNLGVLILNSVWCLISIKSLYGLRRKKNERKQI